MSLLADHPWLVKYTPDDGDLVSLLYIPALRCAVRYDRLTGYFSASALALEQIARKLGRLFPYSWAEV